MRTIEDHQRFWKEIYYNDQHYRGKLANINNDHKNLVAVSYYINLFGYPDVKVIGRESDIASVVWSHTKSMLNRKLAFPIILEAFKKKLINENDLRKYYLLSLYNYYFSDYENEVKPLTQLFRELDLNTSKNININQLVEVMRKYNEFLNAPKEYFTKWIQVCSMAEPKYFKTRPYFSCGARDTLIIYNCHPDEYYMELKFTDNSFDPVKLERIKGERFKFKYRNKESECYYEISDESILYLLDRNGIIIEKYDRVNPQ